MGFLRGRPVLALVLGVLVAEVVITFRDKLHEDRVIRELAADFNERSDAIQAIRARVLGEEFRYDERYHA